MSPGSTRSWLISPHSLLLLMMSHRTTRSNSIPIPIGSPRNIEDVISMPFVASPGTLSRPHFAPQSLSQTSPGHIRGPVRSLSNSYEPRIIRASPSRNSDISCVSVSPSLSPTRLRRLSSSNTAQSPTISPRNPSSSRSVFNPSPAISSSSSSSFPQPAYLEHSALRDLLRTETLSSLPSSRYRAEAAYTEPGNAGVNTYPYIRRERTPLIDSDDESFLSPPRDIAPPVVNTAINPSLHLPTRWSDHDHSTLLSVSLDGRELIYSGRRDIENCAFHFFTLLAGTSCIGDKDAAAARSNYQIPPACGIYYYEVEILNKGQKKGCVEPFRFQLLTANMMYFSQVSIGFVNKHILSTDSDSFKVSVVLAFAFLVSRDGKNCRGVITAMMD